MIYTFVQPGRNLSYESEIVDLGIKEFRIIYLKQGRPLHRPYSDGHGGPPYVFRIELATARRIHSEMTVPAQSAELFLNHNLRAAVPGPSFLGIVGGIIFGSTEADG